MPSSGPQHPARGGEQRRLGQELGGDVRAGGAERAPHAHLAGPLGDARQHDVHDPDAAHEQADGGDGARSPR